MATDLMFYALLLSGVWLTLWGMMVKNTGGFASLIIVKIVPAILGILCLFNVALNILAQSA